MAAVKCAHLPSCSAENMKAKQKKQQGEFCASFPCGCSRKACMPTILDVTNALVYFESMSKSIITDVFGERAIFIFMFVT